jgi:hypothetical protein
VGIAALGLALTVSLAGTAQSGGVAAAGVVLVVGSDRLQSTGGLVGSIASGAVVTGAVVGLVAAVTELVPFSPLVAAGIGIAVGGGLGSVVWLVSLDDEEPDTGETVTVDMDEGDAVPTPEPVDLFEASPDPILFYTETPDGPVVRAVNPAFTDAFGVTSEALDGTPLRDGLFVADDAEAVLEAARASDVFDEVVACETEAGDSEMRLRIAATGRSRTDGYVLYTPVE